MSHLGVDESIRRVFLTEADEIVQRLYSLLQELQYGCDGRRILEDIHRAFHTLAGGAAVLGYREMADCAQLTSRVMERLLERRLALSPGLVAVIVSAAGAAETMLQQLHNGPSLLPMSAELQRQLQRSAGFETDATGFMSAPNPRDAHLDFLFTESDEVAGPASRRSDTMSDHEFELLLDGLYGKGRGPTRRVAVSADTTRLQQQCASQLAVLEPVAVMSRVSDGGGSIGDLIRELAWVRNRLLDAGGRSDGEELGKALAYLDLVTGDMEQWLDRQ